MPRLSAIAIATSTFALLAFASGCTWVHMAPGAKAVQVIKAGGAPAGCDKVGEISVSVKDSVAFYERNDLRVRDELETLARNEAPGMNADTIQPLSPPRAGEQRFAAYHCGATVPMATPSRAQPEPPAGATTYPVGG